MTKVGKYLAGGFVGLGLLYLVLRPATAASAITIWTPTNQGTVRAALANEHPELNVVPIVAATAKIGDPVLIPLVPATSTPNDVNRPVLLADATIASLSADRRTATVKYVGVNLASSSAVGLSPPSAGFLFANVPLVNLLSPGG